MKYLIASVLILFILSTLSLCKASSDADKRIEIMMEEEKEKNN